MAQAVGFPGKTEFCFLRSKPGACALGYFLTLLRSYTALGHAWILTGFAFPPRVITAFDPSACVHESQTQARLPIAACRMAEWICPRKAKREPEVPFCDICLFRISELQTERELQVPFLRFAQVLQARSGLRRRPIRLRLSPGKRRPPWPGGLPRGGAGDRVAPSAGFRRRQTTQGDGLSHRLNWVKSDAAQFAAPPAWLCAIGPMMGSTRGLLL